MSALTQERMREFEKWTYHLFRLASGKKAFKGGAAVLAAGKVYPAGAGVSGVYIGIFARTVDATAGERDVNVDLSPEIHVEWFANDGSIEADDISALAYLVDDQTVTLTADDVLAGRIWAVDKVRGVAVQKLLPSAE